MPADDQTFVEFEKVQKSYDGATLVVKDLNLSIARGEFLTLLGPSGSGKTTCLMMLAGFEAATHGEIRLAGRPIGNVAPHRRGIGMVFQNYALFPHMTVAENLAFPLQVRGMGRSEIRRRVARVLDMVKLGGMERRRPAQLSGGQQQRIAVARALVFEPDLVLMDEPLGALDKNLREQMQYEIRRMHENLGVTIVYVTHDQSEALTMSDRIAVFDDGVIQQLAAPDTLYERPENAFVARFIGENNRLLGRIKALDGDGCTVEVGGSEIRALRVNVGGPGVPATLSLRPECVEIDPPEGKYPNLFDARVEESIYLGDHVRMRVAVCGNDEFVIKIPNTGGYRPLRVGDTAKVGWKAEDCRALDAPAQHS